MEYSTTTLLILDICKYLPSRRMRIISHNLNPNYIVFLIQTRKEIIDTTLFFHSLEFNAYVAHSVWNDPTPTTDHKLMKIRSYRPLTLGCSMNPTFQFIYMCCIIHFGIGSSFYIPNFLCSPKK